MSTVTAQDRALASDLIQRVIEGDVDEVAKILAAVRETAISCAVARMDREYKLTQRTTRPRVVTLRREEDPR